jgi:hypothetical protein
MGKKILMILTSAILLVGCSNKAKLYNMTIDVASKKEGGMEWDVMGGAPDIKVIINKHPLRLSKRCENTYRCNYSFTSSKDIWYIEVYDSDIENDDLIGKGDCQEGEWCSLGLAQIYVED